MLKMSKRLNFFMWHLLISSMIALLFIFLVFCVWYPSPLAKALGVTQIFLMLVLIDVIIGPLLTLMVYKEGKKTLKMDLSIIVLFQMIALGYGLFSINQGRPVWFVYANIDRFELVRASELKKNQVDKASPEFRTLNLFGPQFATIKKEKTVQAQNERMFMDLSQGLSAELYPERYTKLSHSILEIQHNAKDLSILDQYNEKINVTAILQENPTASAWLPLRTNVIDMVVLINKEKGEVVKIVDLRPWK